MKLKDKLTLIVSGLVVTIVTLTALFAFSHYNTSLKKTIAQQQFLMLSIIADEIDSKLLTAQQHLLAVSKTMTSDIMQNPAKAQAFLDNKPSLHTMLDNHLFLFTPSGRIFVESPYAPGRRGFDLSYREYIIETIKTKKPYISDPYVSTQPHQHPVIMLTAPILDAKGNIAGILTGSVDLMRDNFLGRISNVKIGKAGYLYLSAVDRTLIMHPDKKRILTKQAAGFNNLYDKAIEGFEGTGDTITSQGVKMVSSFKKLKVKDWIMAANYPQAEAYLPIDQARGYFITGTIIGIVTVFLIISFIIKYLTNPLELFTSHVNDLPQKTGHNRFFHINTADEIGTLSVAFNKMVLDIDSKRVELEKSEDLYRTVTEFATDFVFWRSPDKKNIYVSQNSEKFCGYTQEEFYSSPDLLDEIIHPDDAVIWAEHTHYKRGMYEQLEFRIITKSGDVRWIAHNCVAVYDKDGNYRGRRGSHQDITDTKKSEEEKASLESQLLQSQKMEAIGQIAGGIAHDFNNLLTAINGFAELLSNCHRDGSYEHQYVQNILSSGEKAANLARGLLTFSRKNITQLEPISLNATINGIYKLLEQVITEDIVLKIELTNDGDVIIADKGQIEQVIINLVANARDSMPKGGTISIATESVNLDTDYAQRNGLQKSGNYALLTVSDTGTGMDQNTMKKIFEPFFTTKGEGKGTGLGLSIIYGIIKRHSGSVTCTSIINEGTTFSIYMPLAETKPVLEQSIACTGLERGTETILIADDNEEVRSFMITLLTTAGYSVLVAIDGEDALKKFIAFGDSIDMVILDVVMPKKNGREVYDEIKKIRPDVEVLFTSGYTAEYISEKSIREQGMNFISKPALPSDILLKVRMLLDKNKMQDAYLS